MNESVQSRGWIWIGLGVATTGLLSADGSSEAGSLRAEQSRAIEPSSVAPRIWRERPKALNRAGLGGERVWQSPRLPSVETVTKLLTAKKLLSKDSSAEERRRVLKAWYAATHKTAYIGPDPFAAERLKARERALIVKPSAKSSDSAIAGELLPPEFLGAPQKTVLGVVVNFEPPGGSETFERSFPLDPADPSLGCASIEETRGALHIGEDPPPGPLDNFTFYKPGITTEDYQSVFFGVGPSAGYGVVRPDLNGGVDLTGLSLNNYLLEMSRGTYTTSGEILPVPVVVPHSHEWYGHAEYEEDLDGLCSSDVFSDAHYQEFANDVAAAIRTGYDGVIDFAEFDADGDHLIDLLAIIHAGYSFQAGGGEDRLTQSSSGFFNPEQVSGFLTPDDSSDDYFISGFNVDPEQLDLGGVQEEFEHQFGLPDLYTTDDTSNSNAWWSAHSAGVWGGPLGGVRPVGHNLWQDWILGWRNPLVIDYDDPRLLTGRLSVDIGRARNTPEGVEDGIIIRLPDSGVPIPNLAGTGVGWFPGSGDLLDNQVSRAFDLTGAVAPLTFSFASTWDIEEDFDYGLIEFTTDGGASWFTLPDLDGILTDEDANLVGLVSPGVAWGLTGAGSGTLRFDLSEFAGQTVGVRFHYLTDPSVSNPGWHVDDLLLEDGSGTVYENDLETDFSDWTNTGWLQTPLTRTFPRYYLVEWRDDSGYDASLHDPYNVHYTNPVEPPPETRVEHLSYTTPGLVVAFRDTEQPFDYALTDSILTGNSIGPKYAHLVIDSHPEPLSFDTPDPERGNWVGINLHGGIQPGDAAFGLIPTLPLSASRGFDPVTGTFEETKSWPSRPGVAAFHDSFGYYPGLFVDPEGGFDFHDLDGSAVLPSKGPYTTRITDPEGNPVPELYGDSIEGFVLGTGNPGDDHVQFGLHIEVESGNAERGRVQIWNRPYEVKFESSVTAAAVATTGGGSVRSVSANVVQNIGGKLVNPLIVFQLPPGLEYVTGSASGGLEPLTTSLDAPQQIADSRSKSGVFPSDTTEPQVRFLVWSGADVPTTAGLPEIGFQYRSRGVVAGDVEVSFFTDANSRFQTETIRTKTTP
jgi:immune inhibitor A